MEPSPGLDYIQHNVEIGHNYAGLFDINCNILIWIEQLLDGQANAGLSHKNASNSSRRRNHLCVCSVQSHFILMFLDENIVKVLQGVLL